MGTAKSTLLVGATWELSGRRPHVVVRPDGEAVTVSDGLYVLTMPGTYTCGDDSMEAKA